MMAAVRGRDTRSEMAVRRYLHRASFRDRLHMTLPGKPEIVPSKFRTALFVYYCFWLEKFAANIDRDAAVKRKLRALG